LRAVCCLSRHESRGAPVQAGAAPRATNATQGDPGRPNATQRDQGRPSATKGDPCAHADAGGQQLDAIRALNSREGLVPIRQLEGVAARRYPARRQAAPDATSARGSTGALDRQARAALPAGPRMERLVCLWFAGSHRAATLDRLLSWPPIVVWPTIARSIPVLEPFLSSSQLSLSHSCPRGLPSIACGRCAHRERRPRMSSNVERRVVNGSELRECARQATYPSGRTSTAPDSSMP